MTGQQPIAWAVYGGKTGILRYVERDAERVRELVEEGGYEARPLFESSPPANDVREALEGHLREAVRMGIGWPKADFLDRWIAERLDTILAEVRPHGTVTEAEVEAAALVIRENDDSSYGVAGGLSNLHRRVARAVLEAAREVHP